MITLKRTCVLLAAAIVLATHGVALAQVPDAYFAFTSDPGDYIGGGQARMFTLDTASFTSSASQDGNQVAITLLPFAGGFWWVNMAAPVGTVLAPGAYNDATRWPFQAPGVPGLSVSGDGRGCNQLTGSFQVLEAVFGPAGYIERFHATFEQHCEGAEPAFRGEVQIVNPPPPDPLEITLSADSGSVKRLSGDVTLSGTITCSQATSANLFGVVRQRLTRFALASGSFSGNVACSPTPARWTVTIPPDNGVPFGSGMAILEMTINAFDPNYGSVITINVSNLVRLKQVK